MISNASFTFQQQVYDFNPAAPVDISIPLASETVNCYYADPVEYQTIRVGDFVGSTQLGGSCNYQKITLTPHGNGTHTECYGHISKDGATIRECLQHFLFFARLISVPIEELPGGDRMVRTESIRQQLGSARPQALIIRTQPNGEDKKRQQYSGTNPPYIESDAGNFLVEAGIEHLLLDLPSVDREWDEGALKMHRAFWQYPAGHPAEGVLIPGLRRYCTITELVYVADSIADGDYLLNLQVISLESDASPSKPVLYPLYKRKA